MFKLLSRKDFREGVFARDDYKCVVCKNPAVDAHHIMERRLFPDEGYYAENGASLCGDCHIKAEQTVITTQQLRELCGITKVVLPPHLYDDNEYDKWGNIILPNGQRVKGELFNDESVQKILASGDKLKEFAKYVKYPRTYHLPWSPGVSKDDRVMTDLSSFEGKEVVVTIKMDGENFTGYNDYCHARSIDSNNHPSRNYAKAIHANIAQDIPEDWRICCENLYAKHSIGYKELPTYLLMFSIWDEKNNCLSWDETVEWAQLLNLQTVPVVYRGIWNEELIKKLYKPKQVSDKLIWNEFEGSEGYVVRLADSFNYKDFRRSVAKYVRANHVQTHGHWIRNKIEPNELGENK